MSLHTGSGETTKPNINVTPLIDVLLVLLIIFMVAVPLKPQRFLAKAPAEPDHSPFPMSPDPLTLVVTIQPDHSLKLNSMDGMGTIEDTSKLSERLTKLFAERRQNRAYRHDSIASAYLTEDERVQRTVFIKAPRSLSYGNVVKVIDGLKGAGASPIGLQLDGLN